MKNEKELHLSHRLVLKFIKGHLAEFGVPPSVREIADDVVRSPNAVVESLLSLKKNGLIELPLKGGRRILRGIILTDIGKNFE